MGFVAEENEDREKWIDVIIVLSVIGWVSWSSYRQWKSF